MVAKVGGSDSIVVGWIYHFQQRNDRRHFGWLLGARAQRFGPAAGWESRRASSISSIGTEFPAFTVTILTNFRVGWRTVKS